MLESCLCTNFPNFKTIVLSKNTIRIINVLKEAHTRNINGELLREVRLCCIVPNFMTLSTILPKFCYMSVTISTE